MAIVGGTKYTWAREISRRHFGRSPRIASPRNFARPTIAIAKIRDYSQSTLDEDKKIIYNACVMLQILNNLLTQRALRVVIEILEQYVLTRTVFTNSTDKQASNS